MCSTERYGAEGELKRADVQLVEKKTAFEERTSALKQKNADSRGKREGV